jgi:hypothetical protein
VVQNVDETYQMKKTVIPRKRTAKIKIDEVELQHFAVTPQVPSYWRDLYYPEQNKPRAVRRCSITG